MLVGITSLGSKSQLFYRKVLQIVLPLTSAAQISTRAGPLRVGCAVKHSTSAAYLDIEEEDH
jgi:hypothetical protein